MFNFSILVFSALIAAPAFAGRSIKPPDPIVYCEFFLNRQPNVPKVMRWLKDALGPLVTPSMVFTGYAPKAAAFAALGLPYPYPSGTVMKIEAPLTESDPYWLAIYAESGEELLRYPFHVPPLVVWKQLKALEIEDETHVSIDLYKEDPNTVSAGVLLGSVPSGRKFISVRRRMPNLVTVAVGIDVDIREHKTFTESPEPHFIGTSNEEVLSRIEVVKAHFRVPAPAPKRRGGPYRVI